MPKRKANSMWTPDLDSIVDKFNAFVSSLAILLDETPEDNFPLKDLPTSVEDRLVIAKVLKRMRIKGQLSWMDQYLKEEERPRSAPPPLETASCEISAFQTLVFDEIAAQIASTADKDLPPLPRIHNQALLNQAFTHRSYATACAPARSSKDFLTTLHNERLEFLGDSFLNHSVTKMLFTQLPEAREGELSLLRAELIGNTTAAEFGRRYGFDKQLLLNDTAERDGVRKTPKVIADTFEAYLGALILDGTDGVVRADAWLRALMAPRVQDYLGSKNDEPIDTLAKQKVWNHFIRLNPTTTICEDGATRPVISVSYDWVDGGGGNEGGFVIAAVYHDPTRGVDRLELGRGFGLKKKEAEHRAAMDAVKKLGLDSML